VAIPLAISVAVWVTDDGMVVVVMNSMLLAIVCLHFAPRCPAHIYARNQAMLTAVPALLPGELTVLAGDFALPFELTYYLFRYSGRAHCGIYLVLGDF